MSTPSDRSSSGSETESAEDQEKGDITSASPRSKEAKTTTNAAAASVSDTSSEDDFVPIATEDVAVVTTGKRSRTATNFYSVASTIANEDVQRDTKKPKNRGMQLGDLPSFKAVERYKTDSAVNKYAFALGYF